MGCIHTSATQAKLQRGDIIVVTTRRPQPLGSGKEPKGYKELTFLGHQDPTMDQKVRNRFI